MTPAADRPQWVPGGDAGSSGIALPAPVSISAARVLGRLRQMATEADQYWDQPRVHEFQEKALVVA